MYPSLGSAEIDKDYPLRKLSDKLTHGFRQLSISDNCVWHLPLASVASFNLAAFSAIKILLIDGVASQYLLSEIYSYQKVTLKLTPRKIILFNV